METEPFVVRAGQDRRGTPVEFLNGAFHVKISGRDTGGALCLIDTIRRRIGGPPLHCHFDQDEIFHVLEGRFRFRLGDALHELGPGDLLFGPRRVPHGFVNLTPEARLMIAFQPAGQMEDFFALGLLDPASEEFREASRRHGMEVTGPPLTP